MEQGWFSISVLRRTELMIVTVFAPEVITIRAFRQFFVARSIHNREYLQFQLLEVGLNTTVVPRKTLTLTHGFLVSMSAFVYSDGCPITRQNLEDDPTLQFQLAEIPKKDIDDRNKGDGLSKGLAMLQATWFVIHCIARLVNNLPVTIIGTVAIGYAVFTVINYAVWWHKPLGISVPFRATVASPDTADTTPPQSPPGLIPLKLGTEYLLDWVDFHLSNTFFGGDVRTTSHRLKKREYLVFGQGTRIIQQYSMSLRSAHFLVPSSGKSIALLGVPFPNLHRAKPLASVVTLYRTHSGTCDYSDIRSGEIG